MECARTGHENGIKSRGKEERKRNSALSRGAGNGLRRENPLLYEREGMFYLGSNASSSYKGEINFLIAEEAKISPQTLESAWGHTPLVAYDTRAVCTA